MCYMNEDGLQQSNSERLEETGQMCTRNQPAVMKTNQGPPY